MSILRLFVTTQVAACLLSGSARACADEYRGYFQAYGEVDWPSGHLASNVASPAPGWDLSFGLGLRDIPVLLGLRAGDAYVGSSTGSGPNVGLLSSGGITLTGTTVTRRFELRHLELTLRLEPPWPLVRPFIEGSAGFVALWHVSTVDGADGVLDRWEEQRSVAPAWGASVGVDVLPWCKA